MILTRVISNVMDTKNQQLPDADLIRLLKESGKIIDHRQIRHSYPFCWRTETPLIYKAIPTWFVNVEASKSTTRTSATHHFCAAIHLPVMPRSRSTTS